MESKTLNTLALLSSFPFHCLLLYFLLLKLILVAAREMSVMVGCSRKRGLLHSFFVVILAWLSLSNMSMYVDANVAYPTTNENSVTISTGRWFYWGQTADQIGAVLQEKNARVTQLRIEDPSVPTFAVSMS